MPELPEVETTKASLAPLIGQAVAQVCLYQPKLRWPMPDDLETLIGYRLIQITRRAKYLLLHFVLADQSAKADLNARKSLLIHLGMSGSLQQYPEGSAPRKHDHLIITFAQPQRSSGAPNASFTQLHYHDPRRFGAVLWLDDYEDKLLTHLGIEPLSELFNGTYLFNIIQRINTPISQADSVCADPSNDELTHQRSSLKRPISRAIKSVIMDQQIVVGVGNIYATESLYLSGIHPATPADTLSESQLTTLANHIKTILAKSIKLGGSSLRDFTVAAGQTGYFQQTLHAYGRQGEPCDHCKAPLLNIKINGRASVFCPNCQPL